jgi:cAMP-binding proteins - catabolite gene activator and regulatory subunit of cAMP-dependent protein kinases
VAKLKATTKQLTAVLGAVPLFEGLSKKQLKKVTDLADVARFMASATLVKQGEIGDSFYVVLTGQAKVVANRRTVNRLLPGDHFGEISLLDGGPRTASVIGETEMTLVIIRQKDFLAMLTKDPEITMCLLQGMARTVRRLDRSLAG